MFWKRQNGSAKTITEYLEFTLHIVASSKSDYIVSVISSPAGEGATFSTLPLSVLEILSQTGAEKSRSETRDMAQQSTSTSELSPKECGSMLFDLLFHDVVRDLYIRSLALAGAQRQGLRIRLKFDLENPNAAYLSRLPWELFFDTNEQNFVSLKRETTVVRYLDLKRPREPLLPQGILRVLVVIPDLTKLDPQPRDLALLEVEREKKNLESVAQKNKNVSITFVDNLEVLRNTFLRSSFHILHFIGHGKFEPESQDGVLYFEEKGQLRLVTGQELSIELANLNDLRLVVLNACHTARAAGSDEGNPFAGVATALLKEGVPTVIAMQRAISDSAAIAFSDALYERLAAGDPIDAALAEARVAIFRQKSTSSEWATPLLFARGYTRIFSPIEEKDPSPKIKKTVVLLLLLALCAVAITTIAWGRAKFQHARAVFAIEQGKANLMTNAPIRARENFLEALRLDDGLAAEAYHGLGLVDLAENKLDDAIVHLQQALDRGPNDQQVNFDIGRVMEKKGRNKEASGYFRKSLSSGGCNPEAAAALGSLLGRLGEKDEAAQVLNRGIECDPNNMDLSIGMAELLLSQGKMKETLTQLDRASRSMPRMDSPQSVNSMQERLAYISILKAKTYSRMKDLENACILLTTARGSVNLELDRESQEIQTRCEKSFPYMYR